MDLNTKKPTGIGIIGCGVIAQHHARAVQKLENARLVAVADVREDAAQKMAQEFGVANIHFDAKTLIENPTVDAVILAMPAGLRFAPALLAFKNGKHVLTEKPVAINAEQAQQLLEARGDLIGASCSGRYLFTETARRAKEFLASGELGQLRMLRSRGVTPAGPPPQNPPPAWRVNKELNGGGILTNWGCYEFDFLLDVLNWQLKPSTVLAKTFSVSPQLSNRAAEGSDAESHVAAFITFENGVAWQYERAEFYPGVRESLWEITGTNGTLRLEMLPQTENPHLVFYSAPEAGGIEERIIWEGEEDHIQVHNGPARDFVNAIRGGVAPRTTLEHALITAQITDAIYASAECGECVTIGNLNQR